MLTPEYCRERAEEYDALAAEADDPETVREWLRMAAEWRLSAHRPGGGPSLGAGRFTLFTLRLVARDGRRV